MRSFDLVVCGGGPAGHAAIRAYREAGGAGTVLLATREDRLPYARPPLSKEYLRGEMTAAELPLDDVAWYAAKEIVTALSSPVRGLDAAHRRLLLAGETIDFATVILATGATPATLPVPGGDDPSILRLREPHDSDRIRSAGARGSVAVIGSGFIGCEVAASLAITGTRVQLVGEEAVPQAALLGDDAGKRIARWLTDFGVELVLGSAVQRIEEGRRVFLANGREVVADAIVTGAGIEPNTELARTAGMELDNDRVPCDASMQTVAPGVLVAGDAAYAWNAAARRRLVVQHWGEAERMGEIAGHIAADQHDAWEQAPGFWSGIGDHTLKHVAWGDGHDDTRLLAGDDDDTFAVLYGRRGTLVGVLTSNLDEVYEQGGALVESGASFHEAAATLSDTARVGDPAS
jgi:NADPH-dependent 2,4-dienoyl-CoA reductase/sulfur reductase-like enzyme